MGTLEFLKLVLPSQGQTVLGLVQIKDDGGSWFKWKNYPNAEEAARAALIFDGRGETVYFGVNSFGDWYTDEKTGKRRIRTQENVVACRSLFDDFDVDVDKKDAYDTKQEAFEGVIELAKTLRLTPSIVNSGGGYHSYIHLDEDITPQVWEELSAMKRDVTMHLNIKADRAVDSDTSRILRPIGVHNRKYDPPRPVELLKEGKVYSVDRVRSALVNFIKENNVQPAPTTRKAGGVNPFAAALGDYPDSDAEAVARNCAAVREFRDSGGNIPEPHWHRAIGVVKFCTDGEAKIHEWSEGYEGYSQIETQDKIDEWSVGPTSCVEMDRHVGCMADCPFADKCKFPLQLGFTEEAESVAEPTVDADDETDKSTTATGSVIEGQTIPYWPQTGYRWNGSALSRSYVDEEGVVHWTPFCRSFIYPINRIQDSEGTWVIHWRALEKNGKWRELFMPMHELASTDMMAKTLA